MNKKEGTEVYNIQPKLVYAIILQIEDAATQQLRKQSFWM